MVEKGIIQHNYMGIVIKHFKDPFQTASIYNVKLFFVSIIKSTKLLLEILLGRCSFSSRGTDLASSVGVPLGGTLKQ